VKQQLIFEQQLTFEQQLISGQQPIFVDKLLVFEPFKEE